jgi:hypothetical protein
MAFCFRRFSGKSERLTLSICHGLLSGEHLDFSAAGTSICSYYIGGTLGGIVPSLLWKRAGWPGCVALVIAILSIAGMAAIFGWRLRPPAPDPIPL